VGARNGCENYLAVTMYTTGSYTFQNPTLSTLMPCRHQDRAGCLLEVVLDLLHNVDRKTTREFGELLRASGEAGEILILMDPGFGVELLPQVKRPLCKVVDSPGNQPAARRK
jgi:hypothetical protein